MNYQNVERDFVKRSLEIVTQYNQYVLPNVSQDQEFEVTLLLNSLLGLLVLPFEHKKRSQGNPAFPCIFDGDDIKIEELGPEWGLDKISIEEFKLDGKPVNTEDTTLRKIIAMFRHSIAHARFGDGSKIRDR